jgi:hypothetical protein
VEQIEYAALDAIVSLQLCHPMTGMTNISARHSEDTASVGLSIDVVPRFGDHTVMAHTAAEGHILSLNNHWITPDGVHPHILNNTKKPELVRVTRVMSPSFAIPCLKRGGKKVCFSDLGAPPFNVMLTYQNIALHVATPENSQLQQDQDDQSEGQVAPNPALDEYRAAIGPIPVNLDTHRDRENALALARLEGAIEGDDIETGDELVEDGIADSLPDLLSGEDYQMFLDCQEAMKNDKGKSPLDAPPSLRTYSICSRQC